MFFETNVLNNFLVIFICIFTVIPNLLMFIGYTLSLKHILIVFITNKFKIKFKVYFTPALPAEEIIYDLEIDVDYYDKLF